jgi:hypothetical protein
MVSPNYYQLHLTDNSHIVDQSNLPVCPYVWMNCSNCLESIAPPRKGSPSTIEQIGYDLLVRELGEWDRG